MKSLNEHDSTKVNKILPLLKKMSYPALERNLLTKYCISRFL
jgi:hypothetical protein